MRTAALLLLLLLGACEDRRSFDQRYSDAERKLDEKATALDRTLQDANAAGQGNEIR
jgi:hypothetical protein